MPVALSTAPATIKYSNYFYALAVAFHEVVAGTWTRTQASTHITASKVASDHAQNEGIQWNKVGLSTGTYTWRLCFERTATYGGKAHLIIDGVDKGSIDTYGASGALNVVADVTGIAITEGEHTIQIVAASKNASSSRYDLDFNWFELFRTA